VGSPSRVSIPTELPDAHDDRLTRSAAALLISNAAGAILGVGFWVVAARLFSANDVGLGVTEIAAMTVLANVASVSLGIFFPRYLHAAGAKAPRVLRISFLTSIGLAIVAGAVWVLPFSHDYIQPGLLPRLAFILAVALWVAFGLQDAALTGLRKTFWVPVKNAVFSVAKIALLPVFVLVAANQGVFLSWALPLLGCVVPVWIFLAKRVLPEHVRWADGRGALPTRRAVGSVLTGEYFGGLAYIALQTVPQLLVSHRLGHAQAAFLQTPWLAGTTFDFFLFNIATSMIVEASARPNTAPAIVRRTVKFTVLLLSPGIVLIVLGAPIFLQFTLGTHYAHYGTRVLQLLALSLPFTAVNALYITYARLARRMRRVAVTQVCITSIILLESLLLIGSMGITGVGVGFLVGQATVAIVVAPSVIRQYRRPSMAPGFESGATLVARGGPQIGPLLDSGELIAPSSFTTPEAAAPTRDVPRRDVDGERAWYVPPWAPEWRWRGRTGSARAHSVDDAPREH
jgi:O-antigen/teichoic acid export membrane protein